MPTRLANLVVLIGLICCFAACGPKEFKYQGPYRSIQHLPAEGTWIVTDEANNTFNIILRDDGTAISSWSRGVAGAYGDRGRWRYAHEGIIVMYESGWMTLLAELQNGFLIKQSYRAGRLINQVPSDFSMLIPLVGAARRYVGIFRCTASDTKEPYYMALISSGLAIKTLGKEYAGTWHLADGKAVIQWSNGWTDVLDYNGGVYQQSAFSPGMDIEKSKPVTTIVAETADGRPYGN